MTAAEGHVSRKKGGIRENAKVIVQALILALIVRTFLFQPFNIPSGSMQDTLRVGDYVFISKYSYGYSRYSFLFGFHVFDGRVWASPPRRGDIAVFALPRDPSIDYIKRVIGLPGDRVQVRNGLVYINDQTVKRERVTDAAATDSFGAETRASLSRDPAERSELFDARA